MLYSISLSTRFAFRLTEKDGSGGGGGGSGPKLKETPIPNVRPTIENYIKDDLPVATPWLAHVLPAPRKDIACEDCGVSTSFSEMTLDIQYILSKKGGTLKTHRIIITPKVNPWD